MTYSYIQKIEPQNKFGLKRGPQNKFGLKRGPQNKFGLKRGPQNKFGTKIKFVLHSIGKRYRVIRRQGVND